MKFSTTAFLALGFLAGNVLSGKPNASIQLYNTLRLFLG